MPFGRPPDPPPTERLDCGCILLDGRDDPDTFRVRYCATHWAELSEERRRDFKRDRRRQLLDSLFGLALNVAIVGLVAFMIWTIWCALSGS